MNIRSVETKTGLTKRMIRHYEDLGLLSPVRSDNGYREYTDADIDHLLCIKAMREVGFSLNEIGLILKDGKTEDVLRRYLGGLLVEQEEQFRRQQARIQVIKGALRSGDTANKLLDRIALAHSPSKHFEGVDNLDVFFQKHHVVCGHIEDVARLENAAAFGDQNEFKIVETTYITYGGVFEENILPRASLALCKEMYSYVLLFSDNSDQFGPDFHRKILNQFSAEWGKVSFPLTLKFEAMTEDIGSLERIFSPFSLALIITAERPTGERFDLVLPGQPLVVYLSQQAGVEYNSSGDWLETNFPKKSGVPDQST